MTVFGDRDFKEVIKLNGVKRIMILDVKHKNIKLVGKNLWDLGLGKEFIDLTPNVKFTKGNIDKLDLT